MTTLTQVSDTQSNKAATVNDIFEAVSSAGLFGVKQALVAGLTFAYFGGKFWDGTTFQDVPDATLALTANATNYIEAQSAPAGSPTEYVSKNITAFTAGAIPLYIALTNATGITALTDYRNFALQNQPQRFGAISSTLGASTSAGAALVKANVNTTAVGNVTTGEDDLITYTLPASAFSAAGKGVQITAWGTSANNANAKTLKLYFGTSAILTNALTVSIAGVWRIEANVFSTGVDAQDYVAQLVTTGTAGVALNDIEAGSLTQDDGATIAIKCTGDATATNDIVQEGQLVTFFN